MKITFLPSNIEYEAVKGESLLEAASKAGIVINGSCNSRGRCGKCKVKVSIGKVSNLDESELNILSQKEIKQGMRLSCRTFPLGDVRVFVSNGEGEDKRKSKLVYMPKDFKSTYSSTYGVAFDIGTTSVVAMLWDREQARLVDAIGTINPQSLYGADVISRITYSLEDDKNLKKLNKAIIKCCNQLIKKLCKKHTIDHHIVEEAVVVGNTTMSQLFLGITLEGLAKTPFQMGFNGAKEVIAKEIGLDIKPKGVVHLLPNIAGHVGSDITAGIIATDLKNKTGLNLMIDVGTNGEMVLADEGKLYTCSTAAGPAFEGAGVKDGMRAASGAIEEVVIKDNQVMITVIDNKKPVGICGSGIIDVIAQLLEVGIIDKTGRLLDKESAWKQGISTELIDRIQEKEEGFSFLIYADHNVSNGVNSIIETIVITQSDIRQIQLAKGAIYAGILMLLKESNKKVEDLDCIMIAGAFGNYIKPESALRIGLLPEASRTKKEALDKIKSLGNTAGVGASMALLSTKERAIAIEIAEKVTSVDLASCDDFKREYIESMNFK